MISTRTITFGGIVLLLVISQAAGKTSPPELKPRYKGHIWLAAPGSSGMKADQVNTEGWNKAWTNLVNDVEQTFVPSMSRLLAVEVELVVGNQNTPDDDLTLSILNSKGTALVSITRIVRAADCEHVKFLLPEAGIEVMPGDSYRIKLSGGTMFGWKYIVGGYPKGAATFNGKPLLAKTRSTFLFRTFGPE
jgi:hypothetical protein